MRRSPAIYFALAVLLTLAVVLGGCSSSGPAWVDAGSSYNTKDLAALYAKADIAKYANTSASDTSAARHGALVALRKQGDAAAQAADLITRTMPADSRGIPVYVERAKIEGQPGLILIEAIGPAKGKLTTKRLWALSDTGTVLFVGTR